LINYKTDAAAESPSRLPGGSLLPPGGEEGLALRQNTGRAEAAAPDPDFSAADAMFVSVA
jgi:hypothetical protein